MTAKNPSNSQKQLQAQNVKQLSKGEPDWLIEILEPKLFS